MEATKGLARVKEIYHNRDRRVRELRAQGKKIAGYLCCYTPEEFMTAAGVVPYRIMGDVKEPVTVADAYTETLMCPFVRSIFDLVLKGRYAFLDGLVIPHSCDNVERNYDILKYHLKPAYSCYINVPHLARPASHEFFRAELQAFQKSLEEFAEVKISPSRLQKAVELHNENRALLRELCCLRKEDPPLLSGMEMTQIIIAAMSLPAGENRELLPEVLAEVKGRRLARDKDVARVLIYGCEIDDVAFIQLVEDCGARVVMDDLCLGTRYYWCDVENNGNLLDNLASRYLDKVLCPRTFRGEKPEERFRYLVDYATEFKAKGIIFYIIRFCDSHAYDAPSLRDYLRQEGLPSLYVEDDYSLATIQPLKTRIQAFIEMLK